MMFKTFQVTENHLKLLKRLNITYDDYTEFGAPAVDPKRPYGNSDVYTDIGEILDVEPEGPGDGYGGREWSDTQQDTFYRLHRDMETVLQVLVVNLGIQTGTYQTSTKYSNDWRKS